MTYRISGAGAGLPIPQNLYPTQLYNTQTDIGSNRLMLEPGEALAVPPGDNMVQVGSFSVLQFIDPYTNCWTMVDTPRGQPFHLYSSGAGSLRLANLLGCPIAAIVAGGGTSFTQATATITANVGGSTWQPIVGGSLGVKSITAPGSGFQVQPLVLIPGPTAYEANNIGGVPATAYATLTGGTVSGVTMGAVGAGYAGATITGLIVPSQYDPNLGSIVPGTVTFTLTNAGAITAALCTDQGAPLATLSALTLTAAGGAGSGATLTPLVLQTVASTSIVAAGGGWTASGGAAKILSVGGGPVSVSAIGNASVELTGFKPRDVNITGTGNTTGGFTATTIIDSGLFVSTPTAAIAPGGTLPTTLASITFVMGTANDTVLCQPL